jgi:hypothetical protein
MFKPFTASLLCLAIALPSLAHPGHAEHDPSQDSATQKTPRRTSPGKGKEPHSPVEAYKPAEVLGWKLLVHEDLIADKKLHKQVIDEVHHQLFRITRILPEDKVEKLQAVPIWLELQNPYSSSCQYHPGAGWLKENGYLTEKAKAVDIGSAERFLHESKTRQPFVLLHELAHGYHDQHLGFNHEAVLEAYQAAKASGSYDEVLFSNGRKVRHYAMTNQMEYFAECTEAFFGMNDYYPFVRAELKVHDPAMYELLREIWGVKR